MHKKMDSSENNVIGKFSVREFLLPFGSMGDQLHFWEPLDDPGSITFPVPLIPIDSSQILLGK